MICVSQRPLQPYTYLAAHPRSATVDISQLLKPDEEDGSYRSSASPGVSRQGSVPSLGTSTTGVSIPTSSIPSKRLSGGHTHSTESPAKKQSKWSPEEDAKIIQLRGDGLKWEDISKQLPGRSAISCRLHYQNYLERKSEWDEDRKNKLARLYERYVAKRCTRSSFVYRGNPTIYLEKANRGCYCHDSGSRLTCGRKLPRR